MHQSQVREPHNLSSEVVLSRQRQDRQVPWVTFESNLKIEQKKTTLARGETVFQRTYAVGNTLEMLSCECEHQRPLLVTPKLGPKELRLRLFSMGLGEELSDVQGLQGRCPRATPRSARITQEHKKVHQSCANARGSRFSVGVIHVDSRHEATRIVTCVCQLVPQMCTLVRNSLHSVGKHGLATSSVKKLANLMRILLHHCDIRRVKTSNCVASCCCQVATRIDDLKHQKNELRTFLQEAGDSDWRP